MNVQLIITGLVAGVGVVIGFLVSSWFQKKKSEWKKVAETNSVVLSDDGSLLNPDQRQSTKLSPGGNVHWTTFWWHEDQLINQRLTWLGVVESLLFASYGLAARLKISIGEEIATVGMLSTLVVWVGVIGAIRAQIMIAKDYKLNFLGVSKASTFFGWTPPVMLPAIFLATWVALLVDPPSFFSAPNTFNTDQVSDGGEK